MVTTKPPIVPTAAQIDLMSPNNAWQESKVVKSGTNGIIGMYGDETSTRYFFYTKFQLIEDLSTSGTKNMKFMCQVGGSTSDWQGVKYSDVANPGGGVSTD